MKRRLLIICSVMILIIVATLFLQSTTFKNLTTESKMPVLKATATKTITMLQLGKSIESTEYAPGYYVDFKRGELYEWSVKNTFNLPGVNLDKIIQIDEAMTDAGWRREINSVKRTLAEDYAWYRQNYNSFDMGYEKNTGGEKICQNFSFWWKPQDTSPANTFLETYINNYCTE